MFPRAPLWLSTGLVPSYRLNYCISSQNWLRQDAEDVHFTIALKWFNVSNYTLKWFNAVSLCGWLTKGGGCCRTTTPVSSAMTWCPAASCSNPATFCPSRRRLSCFRCSRRINSSAPSSTMTVTATSAVSWRRKKTIPYTSLCFCLNGFYHVVIKSAFNWALTFCSTWIEKSDNFWNDSISLDRSLQYGGDGRVEHRLYYCSPFIPVIDAIVRETADYSVLYVSFFMRHRVVLRSQNNRRFVRRRHSPHCVPKGAGPRHCLS